MKPTIKHTIFALSALSTMSFGTLAQEQNYQPLTEKEEKITNAVGLGSGVVIGVVAGPAGAIVAGFIGALIGDDVNDKEN